MEHIYCFTWNKRNIFSSLALITLISSSVSQVPYLPWKKRYMSHEECLNIQGFRGIKSYPEAHEAFYSTIGNAVNVGVVTKIAKNLLNH